MALAATGVAARQEDSPLMEILNRQRAAIRRDAAPSYERRMQALADLRALLVARQNDVAAAVSGDFGNRSVHETCLAEVMVVLTEIDDCRKHLKKWMKPERRWADWQFWPGRTELLCQPLGVVGVIGAWNYPVQLTLAPMVGAIAAGNHVMVRPSEIAPATGEILQKLLGEIYDASFVSVCTGGLEVSMAFSTLPFDHICFTGSSRVGKIIMQNAAATLTPVTLELGGKSPAVVGRNVPLEKVARRLMRGKLLNAGQTCVAPDYVLVPPERRDELVAAIQASVATMYPGFGGNPDYTTIVNDSQYRRLRGLIADAEKKGARIVPAGPGGEAPDDQRRVLPPVLVLDATDEMELLHEEIFGPILPILPYGTIDEAIDYINDRDRPLALYYFGDDEGEQRKVLDRTLSGGVTINDTLYHVPQTKLPFGGVGASGMGHYHGQHGFLTFSKQRSVFVQSRRTLLDLLRPPYGRLIDTVLSFMTGRRLP